MSGPRQYATQEEIDAYLALPAEAPDYPILVKPVVYGEECDGWYAVKCPLCWFDWDTEFPDDPCPRCEKGEGI